MVVVDSVKHGLLGVYVVAEANSWQCDWAETGRHYLQANEMIQAADKFDGVFG